MAYKYSLCHFKVSDAQKLLDKWMKGVVTMESYRRAFLTVLQTVITFTVSTARIFVWCHWGPQSLGHAYAGCSLGGIWYPSWRASLFLHDQAFSFNICRNYFDSVPFCVINNQTWSVKTTDWPWASPWQCMPHNSLLLTLAGVTP